MSFCEFSLEKQERLNKAISELQVFKHLPKFETHENLLLIPNKKFKKPAWKLDYHCFYSHEGKLRENYSKGSSVDAYEYCLSIQTALVGRQQEYPIKLFKDSFVEYACENTLLTASLRDSVIFKKKL
jgi:hypothetical protein